MRARKRSGGLSVNAIAGTHVVFLGIDMERDRVRGLRGFGIKRFDAETGETIWLRGMKTFASVEPHPAKGEQFSTRDHPVQSFQWSDYSAKPGRSYEYTVVALYGAPGELEERYSVMLSVTTEEEVDSTHSVFFNRGSVATQEYARRFENAMPSVAGPGAYEWLSRGLLEALLAFIGRAGKGWSIHGAVYEFQWGAVLDALREANKRGADVSVLYDDIEKYTLNKKTGDREVSGPWYSNRQAVKKAKIASLCEGRANGRLMHNKFFVLSKGGRPKAVWTGSTNLTENGIFGHSNVGHIVDDAEVASEFLAYWERLRDDPSINDDYRDANDEASPAPPEDWRNGTTCVFSPRNRDLTTLSWYADIARSARRGLFMTFAFGMHDEFKSVYRQEDGVLRMALMETPVSNPREAAAERKAIQEIRDLPNVVVSIGNRIETNSFDRWLSEMAQVRDGVHVRWIHTKYMLVDPLGNSPIVVGGSANFSKASTDTNDENMLVIHGDKRVADIYFGEYMRLCTHYAFREAVKWALEKKKSGIKDAEEWKPNYLDEQDKWWRDSYSPNDRTGRRARREYFGGAMSL